MSTKGTYVRNSKTEFDFAKLAMATRQLLRLEKERLKTSLLETQKAASDLEDFLKILSSQRDHLKPKILNGKISSHTPYFVPHFKIARAWKKWFSLGNDVRHVLDAPSGPRPRIAFVAGGGIGDMLKASSIFPALHKKFGTKLYVFCSNPVHSELLRDNPYCYRAFILDQNEHSFTRECLRHLPVFDLVVSWRYGVTYHFPPGSTFLESDCNAIFERSLKENRPYRKYFLDNDVWPKFNNGFGRDAKKNDMSLLDLAAHTSALDSQGDAPLTFVPVQSSAAIINRHSAKPYVTVHDGLDPYHPWKKTVVTDHASTKNLPSDTWRKILSGIRTLGLDIVQLGSTGEAPLPGVDHIYNGLTTLSETAMLIKNAACHVDTEGGLVHLARAMHTRSVVMFGPTPKDFFGYRQNANLEPKTCKNCWYTTITWAVQCPRLTSGPQCMREHDPAIVLGAIKEILDDQRSFSVRVSEGINDEVGKVVQAINSAPTGSRLLWVGARYPSELAFAHGQDLHAVITDPKELKNIAPNILWAAAINLPVESDSVDFVLTPLAEWGANGGAILREMTRVLRPGGTLLALGSKLQIPSLQQTISSLLQEAKLSYEADYAGQIAAGFRLVKILRDEQKNLIMPDQSAPLLEDETPDAWMVQIDAEIEALKRSNAIFLSEREKVSDKRERLDDTVWDLRTEIARLSSRSEGWIEASVGNPVASSGIENFLAQGWSSPEGWGVWGEGHHHSLSLALENPTTKDLEVEVEFNLISLPKNLRRTVDVFAGGKKIGAMEHSGNPARGKFIVPNDCLLENSAVAVTFVPDCAIVPATIDANSVDQRALGVGLLRFRYRPR